MKESSVTTAEIRLLGGFEVAVDGAPVSPESWTRRQAATLVKVLALTPGRRLHRDQVVDRLWPDLTVAEAAPRLHKLAHYARRALGSRSAVTLQDDVVALLPDDGPDVVDVHVFEGAAARALADADEAAAAAAADLYGGTLLPDDLYEPWADAPRESLRARYRDVLRCAGRWTELLAEDPAAEDAHLAVMRQQLAAGDHRAALRQFERMDAALRRELGIGPSRQALELRDRVVAAAPGLREERTDALVGREPEREHLERLLAEARAGHGRTVLVSGPPGIGKTTLLDWLRHRAAATGWRTGHGAAAVVEGAWPYAPVIDALADLCRRHPALLDGLEDDYRREIERTLAGADLSWSGESTRQRLFVAVAELVRAAAGSAGLVLTIDDLHEADEASLRLVHYLARCLSEERALLVVGHRASSRRVDQLRASLARRNLVADVPLRPLDRRATDLLVRSVRPEAGRDVLDEAWEVSAGLPFTAVELATAPPGTVGQQVDPLGLDRLGATTRQALQRVAVIGKSFSTDQLVVLTGLSEAESFAVLDAALEALVVVHTGSGFAFRHALVRDALLADIPAERHRDFHHQAAVRLEQVGAPPARIAHHLIAAGQLADAVPHVLTAVETEAAVGAFQDALRLVDAVRDHAGSEDRARLLALRANLLAALGDRGTADAFRAALAVAPAAERPLLRARMGQAAIMEGDLDSAAAILDGLEPDGGPADVAVLLAHGSLAYLRGDVEVARQVTDRVSGLVGPDQESWQRLDLLALQAMIAHHRGELFGRLRGELRRAHDDPALAVSLYDPYLCVVEFLLYGTTPYAEIVELGRSLRETARRSGVLRAEAFATSMLGEAALLAGDLDVAERELNDALDLYREIGTSAGEPNALERLAELRLLQGDRAEAVRLLRVALPRARWSLLAPHLIQRVLGTMIRAAPDPQAARIVVDQGRDTIRGEDACLFCDIMFAVPAAIACSDVGDLTEARWYLGIAERSQRLWEGTAWQAAVLEARAHLARALGDAPEGARLLDEAAGLFESAGQPLDATRCRALEMTSG